MEVVIAATIMQAAGSIMDGFAQADMYKQQAAILSKQAITEQVNNDRNIAVEKSAAATESLERTKKLQRIIGSTISAGAYAGLATDTGLISNINSNSRAEAAIEQNIANSNSAQRMTSLNLNSATTQLNLKQQASQAKSQASSSILKGFMGAAQSAGSFYSWKTSMGKADA